MENLEKFNHTVTEFGEELESKGWAARTFKEAKHVQRFSKKGMNHRLTGPYYEHWTLGDNHYWEQKYAVDGIMVSKKDYPEAVKAYKLKHGIPLDVGPEWKPGQVNNEELEAPTAQQLHCHIMHLDGKVAGIMERLNELEAKEPAKPAPPKHKTLEEVINAKPDDEGMTIRIYPGGNGGFVTELPEFPGCMSSGDTVLEALFGITWAYKDLANED